MSADGRRDLERTRHGLLQHGFTLGEIAIPTARNRGIFALQSKPAEHIYLSVIFAFLPGQSRNFQRPVRQIIFLLSEKCLKTFAPSIISMPPAAKNEGRKPRARPYGRAPFSAASREHAADSRVFVRGGCRLQSSRRKPLPLKQSGAGGYIADAPVL
jgi:hypothetical protein